MEVFLTPLKQLISLAKDAEITYKILKAEDLLSELGLNRSDQIVERITQINNEKYDFDARTPTSDDFIEEFLLNGYLNEKGEQFTKHHHNEELFEEAFRKAIFYGTNLTSTCRHCVTEVSADACFCPNCGQSMISEKENKAALFIKNSNLTNEWAKLDFLIGKYRLKIIANENYPPLFLSAGTYKYDVNYWIAEYRGIGNSGTYNFVGNKSYDLIFSLENSCPGLQIIKACA